ncbi:MAG TPA: XRE family transcriptional regulator [Xanthobacteraceae bacterium]|nr:XRE family transcriptional regulator [Xanthobacteraceae bacterium]
MAKAVATRKRKAQTGSSGDVRPSGISGFAEEALPFAADFFDADGTIAVDRVADAFCLTKFQLADILGLARETLYKQSRARAPKTQARIREMLEIISFVEDWAGGKLQAMAWYRAQGIPEFGGRTAESLVKDGRASWVRIHLDRIAMGGFA